MNPTRTIPRLVLALAVAALAGVACQPAAEKQQADEDEIEQVLRDYLSVMSQAYATGEMDVLEGRAAPKEIAVIERQITERAMEGQLWKPTLRELAIDNLDTVGETAYVTTLETWDIQVGSAGSDRVLREEPGLRYRVRYQLTKEDGHWLVLFREIAQTLEE
jgi:hypothetical protein